MLFRSEGKFWVNNHAHILKSKNPKFDQYYCELLELTDFTTSITGSAQPKLTLEAIKEIPVCVPPEDEVTEIIARINEISTRFEKQIELHDKQLKTYKEFREALISSVVTGKLRVTEEMI